MSTVVLSNALPFSMFMCGLSRIIVVSSLEALTEDLLAPFGSLDAGLVKPFGLVQPEVTTRRTTRAIIAVVGWSTQSVPCCRIIGCPPDVDLLLQPIRSDLEHRLRDEGVAEEEQVAGDFVGVAGE